MLVFEENYRWKGKGIFSDQFSEVSDFSTYFRNLIMTIKEAGKVFQRLNSSDQRLIGQERFTLAEKLEEILGGFFYLYKRFLSIQSGPFISQYTNADRSFTVEFEGTVWRGTGTLS